VTGGLDLRGEEIRTTGFFKALNVIVRENILLGCDFILHDFKFNLGINYLKCPFYLKNG